MEILPEDFVCNFFCGISTLCNSGRLSVGNPYKVNIPKSRLERLESELKNDKDDKEFEEEVWKNNLLTVVLYERENLEGASKLNKSVLKSNPDNLMSLVNRYYLHRLKRKY